MTFRTLRCANAGLYLCATTLVWGAAAYTLCCRDVLWQQVTAAAAALVSLVWGGHYVYLRFTVDDSGVERRSLFGTRKLLWSELTEARLQEQHTEETCSLTLFLLSPAGHMTLSSDLLPPEEMEALAAELREAGYLKESGKA